MAIPLAVRELDAVISEDNVDRIGHGSDEIAEELCLFGVETPSGALMSGPGQLSWLVAYPRPVWHALRRALVCVVQSA